MGTLVLDNGVHFTSRSLERSFPGWASERRPNRSAWSLAFLAFELFDLLLQRGDAVEGVAMTILPISDLLTEFEVLAVQAIDFGV